MMKYSQILDNRKNLKDNCSYKQLKCKYLFLRTICVVKFI